MTIQSDSLEQVVEAGDDWLALEHNSHNAVIGWCENHPGLAVLGANLMLWGAIICGFHFG